MMIILLHNMNESLNCTAAEYALTAEECANIFAHLKPNRMGGMVFHGYGALLPAQKASFRQYCEDQQHKVSEIYEGSSMNMALVLSITPHQPEAVRPMNALFPGVLKSLNI